MNDYSVFFSMGFDYMGEARNNWAVRLRNTIEVWHNLPCSDAREERIYRIGLELHLRLATLNMVVDNSGQISTECGIEEMLGELGISLPK